MSFEACVAVPVAVEYEQVVLAPGVEAPAPPLPDVNQVRAVEQVFSQEDREAQQVIGLLGMYMGAMVLHDVAVETFSKPADELEEEELRRRRRQPRLREDEA